MIGLADAQKLFRSPQLLTAIAWIAVLFLIFYTIRKINDVENEMAQWSKQADREQLHEEDVHQIVKQDVIGVLEKQQEIYTLTTNKLHEDVQAIQKHQEVVNDLALQIAQSPRLAPDIIERQPSELVDVLLHAPQMRHVVREPSQIRHSVICTHPETSTQSVPPVTQEVNSTEQVVQSTVVENIYEVGAQNVDSVEVKTEVTEPVPQEPQEPVTSHVNLAAEEPPAAPITVDSTTMELIIPANSSEQNFVLQTPENSEPGVPPPEDSVVTDVLFHSE